MEEVLKLVRELTALAFAARVYVERKFEEEGGLKWLEAKRAGTSTPAAEAAAKAPKPAKAPKAEKPAAAPAAPKTVSEALGKEEGEDAAPATKEALDAAYKIAAVYIDGKAEAGEDKKAVVEALRKEMKEKWGVQQISGMKLNRHLLEFAEFMKEKLNSKEPAGVGL